MAATNGAKKLKLHDAKACGVFSGCEVGVVAKKLNLHAAKADGVQATFARPSEVYRTEASEVFLM